MRAIVRACVCVHPGGLDKLVAGEGLVVGQNAQWGGAHLLQYRVDTELHQVVDAVHQQLQVPWTDRRTEGGGGRRMMDEHSSKEAFMNALVERKMTLALLVFLFVHPVKR